MASVRFLLCSQVLFLSSMAKTLSELVLVLRVCKYHLAVWHATMCCLVDGNSLSKMAFVVVKGNQQCSIVE